MEKFRLFFVCKFYWRSLFYKTLQQKYISQNDTTAIINCISNYHCYPPYGGAILDQDFTITNNNGEWLISDTKINSIEKFATYKCSDFEFSDLNLNNITKKGFSFKLIVVSNESSDSGNFAGALSGYAKFTEKNHAQWKEGECVLDFNFNKDTELEIIDTNCDKYRNNKISFNGIYSIDY